MIGEEESNCAPRTRAVRQVHSMVAAGVEGRAILLSPGSPGDNSACPCATPPAHSVGGGRCFATAKVVNRGYLESVRLNISSRRARSNDKVYLSSPSCLKANSLSYLKKPSIVNYPKRQVMRKDVSALHFRRCFGLNNLE